MSEKHNGANLQNPPKNFKIITQSTMKEARSTLDQSNLQEFLDAEVSSKKALNTGQAPYFTPSWLVDQCHARMVREVPMWKEVVERAGLAKGN